MQRALPVLCLFYYVMLGILSNLFVARIHQTQHPMESTSWRSSGRRGCSEEWTVGTRGPADGLLLRARP